MKGDSGTGYYQTMVFQGNARRTAVLSLALHLLAVLALLLWPYLQAFLAGKAAGSRTLDAGAGGGGGGIGDSIGVQLTGGLPEGDEYTKPPLKPLEPPAPAPAAPPAAAGARAPEAEDGPPALPVPETVAPPRPNDFLVEAPAARKPAREAKKKAEEKPKPKPAEKSPVRQAAVPDKPGAKAAAVAPRTAVPEGSATPEGVRKAKGGFGGDDLTRSGVGTGPAAGPPGGGGVGGGSGGGAGGGTGISVGPGRGFGSGPGDSWYALVEKRIGDNWLANLGTDFKGVHHVAVEIVIRKDGTVETYRILEEETKASPAFIRSAMGAVERSRRLIPFPPAIRSERLTLTVAFDFPFRN